jgi:hypothetical protein
MLYILPHNKNCKKTNRGQVQWLTPIAPTTQEEITGEKKKASKIPTQQISQM